MVIGVCTVTIQIPGSHSLKDKRQVVHSLTSRLRAKFSAAVAEVDTLDIWQTATIGVACVSSEGRHADEMIQKILVFIESETDDQISASHFELVHL